jgi:hypothetical protein
MIAWDDAAGAQSETARKHANRVRSSTIAGPATAFACANHRIHRLTRKGLAAHIRNGHDVFVTSNEHFLKDSRRQPLFALGAQDILTPEETLAKVAASR